MPAAWNVIAKCINKNDVFLTNEDMWLIRWEPEKSRKAETQQLDNSDSWNEFVKINTKKYFSEEALNDLEKDMAFWGLPFSNPSWLYCDILDIDKWWYYIARNLDGTIQHDADWKPIYIYHSTKQRVDFDKVWNVKEKFLYFFTRNKKRMIVPPRWYKCFKNMCYRFVDYLNESWWQHTTKIITKDWEEDFKYWLLSTKWEWILKRNIMKFFENIECWFERSWWKKIYSLMEEWGRNQWSFLEIMMWNQFSRLLSDQEYANRFFWFVRPIDKELGKNSFDTYEDLRKFSEAISTYTSRKSTGHFNLIDAMGNDVAKELYWKRILWKFDLDWKEVRELDSDEYFIWTLTKEKFSSLSLEQQKKQLEDLEIYNSKNIFQEGFNVFDRFDKSSLAQKLKIMFWYNPCSAILKFINVIWAPMLYSTFLALWSWLNSLMPLLILNSTMFVTEKMTEWTRLDWDWDAFLTKYWLWDWFQELRWQEWSIWNSLLEWTIKFYKNLKSAFQQWLFNVWDMLMQNSYKKRLYQQYFEQYFPWIKSLSELDEKFRIMKEREWYQETDIDPKLNFQYRNWYTSFDQFLNNAKVWVDQMMRNSTTNTDIRQSNIGTHFTNKPINQPFQDIFYTLFHFFSWWWFAKMRWAWNIINNALISPYRDKEVWAYWLDLLAEWKLPPEKLRKRYLDRQELSYFLNKIHMAFIISKYLERMSINNWENEDSNTLFWNFSDIREYFKLFNWEIAAMESTPEWRMIEIFLSNMSWQLDNWASMWTALVWSTIPTVKEFFRRLTRKTYLPLISTEFVASLNRDWDLEESNWYDLLSKSIQDNCNWFLFYLEDRMTNWEFDYYIPKWPNSIINSFLWIQDKEKAFATEQADLAKFAMMMSTEWAFSNWCLWNLPYLKQWSVWWERPAEWFLDDMNKFRATKAYQAFQNNRFPSDMTNDDWIYVYNTVTQRTWQDSEIDRWTFKATYEYDFKWDDWEQIKWYYKERQIQENIVHYLMKWWITEKEARRFSEIMKNYKDEYVDEAVRTLAYVEANKPWTWMQVLSYIMSSEWVRKTYRGKDKNRSDAQKEIDSNNAKIELAKKYAKFIPDIDKYYTYPQIILRYAKKHDTDIAKYISVSESSLEWNTGKNKLWIPDTDNWYGWLKGKQAFQQNFQAQLMVDIMWAKWEPDAHKLMNWYSLIFKQDTYTLPDWSVDPKYSAYAMKQIENVYNHITNLALDWNTKRILKQWTLMFGDELFTNIVQDPVLSNRADVKESLNDWVHYWYKEFHELDQIAVEYAEDQIANAEYKKNWSKTKWNKNNGNVNWYWSYSWILNWWYNKKFYWFDNWYNTMKSKAYSNNYMKYRIFDWTPKWYWVDYLKYADFVKAKDNYDKIAWNTWTSSSSKNKKWWTVKDDWIWVSTRRGKSIQFYKTEDIDKPVEYRLPWKKRRVKKWWWNDPIKSTTWKSLSPKPKKTWN